MSKRAVWTALFGMTVIWSCGQAQTAGEKYVSENEAAAHLATHSDPMYPAIAKSAHVQGSVLLDVQVDAAGIPTKVDAIGGPLMLRGAASEAVLRWRYRPFERGGSAAPARLLVTVPFLLGIGGDADGPISKEYFPKSDLCRAYLRNRQVQDAKDTCGEALALAKRFTGRENSTNALHYAHELDGQALAFSGDMTAALEEFRAAVAIADQSLTSRDAEYADAYGLQASAEQALGQKEAAGRDYTTAEASYRLAIQHLPNMKTTYNRQLARILMRHAGLLEETGNAANAQAMRAEAETLDPTTKGVAGGNR